MSLDVVCEVEIRRPRAEVAAYVIDPAHDTEWIRGIREARLLGDGPLAVGSRVQRVARFLGRRIDYVNEITRLDDGVLDMRSVKAPFPMHITYEFEDRGASTVMRNHVRGGTPALFAPVVRRFVRRDLHRLRDLLETA